MAEAEKFKISKYVHSFDNHNHGALLNSLTLKKCYGERKLIDKIKNISEPQTKTELLGKLKKEHLDALIENEFLVSSGNDESKVLEKLRDKVGTFDIKNMVMLVSNNCNFRCSYCQIEENMNLNQQKHNMTKEIADKALELFKRSSNPGTNKTITISGGEPLINIKTTKYIIEKARDKKNGVKNSRIVVFTNGSLVTEELAKYFKKNDVLMLVSLDGPGEVHDKVRRYKGGKGTFDSAMRGYQTLKKSGCNVGISAVTGKHNVGNLSELYKFFSDLNPPSIGLNFSHYLIGKDNPTEIPMEKWGKILIDFYRGLRKKSTFVENISRPISAFSAGQPKINECQAQGHGFTVDSRGKIGPCKSLVVSDVYSVDIDKVDDVRNNEMFKKWAMRSPLTEEKCSGCEALGICGGGCAYDSHIANKGDFQRIDERVCNYNKKILDFLIWDLFSSIEKKAEKKGMYIPTAKEQIRAFGRYFDKNNGLQRSVGHEKDK